MLLIEYVVSMSRTPPNLLGGEQDFALRNPNGKAIKSPR